MTQKSSAHTSIVPQATSDTSIIDLINTPLKTMNHDNNPSIQFKHILTPSNPHSGNTSCVDINPSPIDDLVTAKSTHQNKMDNTNVTIPTHRNIPPETLHLQSHDTQGSKLQSEVHVHLHLPNINIIDLTSSTTMPAPYAGEHLIDHLSRKQNFQHKEDDSSSKSQLSLEEAIAQEFISQAKTSSE